MLKTIAVGMGIGALFVVVMLALVWGPQRPPDTVYATATPSMIVQQDGSLVKQPVGESLAVAQPVSNNVLVDDPRFANPSLLYVVSYAYQLQQSNPGRFKAPYGLLLSVGCWESGCLKQFKEIFATDNPTIISNSNSDSTDWGMFQINDKWNPQCFPAAYHNWQEGMACAWDILDICWNRFGGDVAGTLGCYNGSGPTGEYQRLVRQIYQTEFWSGKVPYGFPLPGYGLPIHGYNQGWVRGPKGFHEGAYDYYHPGRIAGIPIYSSLRGTVSDIGVYATANFGRGPVSCGTTYVKIRNEFGWQIIHYHMDELYVKTGDTVYWGQIIGVVGNQGYPNCSSFAHIHYSILENGVARQDHETFFLRPR